MAFYGDRVVKSVSDTTPQKLEVKLLQLAMAMGQKLEVINIYESKNGGLVCWYFHDLKAVGAGVLDEPKEETVTPQVVKKTRKRRGK